VNESNRAQRQGSGGRSRTARKALRGGASGHEPTLNFGRTNYLLLAVGVVAVIVGFILLAQREKSVSPFLLVVGYCLLIPAGLLYRPRRTE
jgi:hypothetical protein